MTKHNNTSWHLFRIQSSKTPNDVTPGEVDSGLHKNDDLLQIWWKHVAGALAPLN